MFSILAKALVNVANLPIGFIKRLIGYTAKAHSAPSGMPSSRRLAQTAAVATGIAAVAYSMWMRFDIPPNTADIIKFLITITVTGVVVGKFTEKPAAQSTGDTPA